MSLLLNSVCSVLEVHVSIAFTEVPVVVSVGLSFFSLDDVASGCVNRIAARIDAPAGRWDRGLVALL